MGQMYTVSFTEVAVTAAVDVFELTPADDRGLTVHGLFLAQSSDFGDAQAEILPFTVIRGHTTSGSGGTAGTAEPLDPRGAAAGFSSETNNTTAASVGTTDTLHADAFNLQAGLGLWLTPECRWKVDQGQTTLVVRLTSAPADSIDLSGTIYVEEG